MAGFFSPSLKFATGMGSFVTGMAKQANENIEHDRAQDEQLEKIRIAKFADGLKQYEEENTSYKKKKGVHETVLSFTGSKRAADNAVNLYTADNKFNVTDYINTIKNENAGNLADPSGYASPFEAEGTQGLQRRYGNLAQMHGSFTNQKVRDMFSLPDNPHKRAADTYFGGAYSQPSGNINEITNPSLSTQIDSGRPTGESISLDTGTPGATSGGGMLNLGGAKITPQQAAILNDSSQYTDSESLKKALIGARMSPKMAEEVVSGRVTAKEKQERDLAIAEARGGNSLQNQYSKAVLDQLKSLPQISPTMFNDMNQIISMVESGELKTGGQYRDFLNAISKFANPLGLDMSKYISQLPPGFQFNKPADIDVANKIGLMQATDIAKNAELYPVSNADMGMTKQIAVSAGTDPMANLYIALVMKGAGERVQMKRQLISMFNKDNKYDPYALQAKIAEFDNWARTTPIVPIVDSRYMGAAEMNAAMKASNLQPGGYYIDKARGNVTGLTKYYGHAFQDSQ